MQLARIKWEFAHVITQKLSDTDKFYSQKSSSLSQRSILQTFIFLCLEFCAVCIPSGFHYAAEGKKSLPLFCMIKKTKALLRRIIIKLIFRIRCRTGGRGMEDAGVCRFIVFKTYLCLKLINF